MKKTYALYPKKFDIDAARETRIADILNEEEKQLLKFFIDSGSFGNKNVLFKGMIERFANGDGKIAKSGKVKYIINTLFPTGPYVKENYPFFHRHKTLLPVMWCIDSSRKYL